MKRHVLFLTAASCVAMGVSAQQLAPGYVTPPNSNALHQYVKNWTPGQELTKNYNSDGSGDAWEDEEFFVSRVALKPQFVNLNTQIDKTMPESENKRLLFWVPINDNAGSKQEWLNALPNATYDNEVFSTWSYVTHYGNWTSPYGWVPGAFADAAHKNGVLVSGVASIPNAGLSGGWATCMSGIGAMTSDADVEKLGKFLRYHGVDGLGYNSEFSSSQSVINNLNTVHGKLVKYMKQYQPAFENVWYGGTTDTGGINFSDMLGTNFYNVFGYASEPRTILFLNYNWNTSYKLTQDATGIKTTGRDPRDLYLGQNMQSGQSHDGVVAGQEWVAHSQQPYSIGLWGAHSVNYIWINRNANGGSDAAKQATYQRDLEYWFTNGVRNPAKKMDIYTGSDLKAHSRFSGMSRYMEARSTLSWDLDKEPFVTYFNVGNGTYYNWNGETAHVGPWYNLGVQDYMPTWRFWFANEYLGTTVSENIDANITWQDAYMGGSCLLVTANNTEPSYMHLFKTQFEVKNNDKITIRYKVLKGTGDVELVWSQEGTESKEAQGNYGKVFDKNGNIYTATNSASGTLEYDGDWQYKTIQVTSRNKLAGTFAALALKVSNAKDLEFMIGEMSIIRGTSPRPAAPQITRAKVLGNNYRGLDGKVFYKMANNKAEGDPVYNLDVNTSMFRLWAKTDASTQPIFMGTTSSWAGLIFSAPSDNATKVQFGVSAVSLDYKTESDIAWSEEMSTGSYQVSDDIKMSKNPITTNEDFVISFVDPAHDAVDWEIKNGNDVIASGSNLKELKVSGIANPGAYDVVAGDVMHAGALAISDPASGRQPMIESLSINGNDAAANDVEVSANQEITLGYTGRDADGIGSRGVDLAGQPFGVKVEDLGIGNYKSFSVAFWIKCTGYPVAAPGSLLLIENRNGSWPKNNWGFFWSRTVEGSFRNHKIDGGFGKSCDTGANGMRLYADYDGNMGTSMWNHLVYVFEYNSSNMMRMRFYHNGKLVTIKNWAYVNKGTREGAGITSESGWEDLTLTTNWQGISATYGSNDENTGYVKDLFPLTANDWIKVGGAGPNGMSAIYGVIDDFQVWDKAMDQDDVNLSYRGLGNLETLPENVLSFWDFEDDPDSDYCFMGRGSKPAKAHLIEYVETEDEGRSGHKPLRCEFSAGSMFVPGTGYKVVTSPTWTAKKGNISNATGNALEGSAKLTYGDARVGKDYTVTLTLANALGQDEMDYPVFKVSAIDGVAADTEEGVEAYTVGDGLFVEFAEDGNYTVEVYNTNGMLMAQKSQAMTAGQNMSVRLGVQGVYIVRVLRDGALARTIKVVRK